MENFLIRKVFCIADFTASIVVGYVVMLLLIRFLSWRNIITYESYDEFKHFTQLILSIFCCLWTILFYIVQSIIN